MIELTDFKKDSDVPQEVIEKYRDVLPDELIEVWKKYGFGSFYGGFLKTVNPDDYADVLHEIAPLFEKEVVMFTTGLADLIVLEMETKDDDRGYAHILLYRTGDFETIPSKNLVFF